MQIKTITRIIAAFLIFSALFFTAALITALTLPVERAGWFIKMGLNLYLRFSGAAFYIPLYLTACGVLLFRDFKFRYIQILLFTLLPFITLSLFLQLVGSGHISSLASVMINGILGRQGGAFVLLTLLMIEMLILMRLVFQRVPVKAGFANERGNASIFPEVQASGVAADQGSFSAGEETAIPPVTEKPSGDEGGFASLLKESLAPVLNSGVQSYRTIESPERPEEPVELEVVEESELPFESFPEETPREPDIDDFREEDSPVVSWESAAAAVQTDISIPNQIEESPDVEEPELEPFFEEDEREEELEDPFVRERTATPDDNGGDDLELPEDLEEESFPEPEPIQEPVLPKLPPRTAPSAGRFRGKYKVPDALLSEYADGQYWIVDDETRRAAEVLKQTLEEFKIAAEVTGISKGPVITMFEILPAPGVKLSKIVNLADNIALGLAASSVRIVAPIPGKHAVGIEVPNKSRAIVSFKEMLEAENRETRKMQVPVILGKDITGGARIIDLVQTPHLLIAGATGSGKSVCVNSLICSILYRRKPSEVKMLLIDPKIVELKLYNGIPHLLTPVITDPKRAIKALQYAVYEMERRYSLLDTLGVREIKSYNFRVKEQKLATDTIPYIVIVVDEFADLMATSGKELEGIIARLTAMSRAVGIHLVLATQRPSVDVITGLIKANVPSRVAFMVASKFDSRIILDEVGAEKLLGKGDMLMTSAWDPNPVRMQGAFLSEEEAERVADHVKSLGEPEYIDDEIFMGDDEDDGFQLTADTGQDPLFETAVSIVVEAGKASASYLQRRLKVGYNRAARLVEEMELRGIVGPANGSKPREIIHIPDRAPSGVSGRGIDTGTSTAVNGLGQTGPGVDPADFDSE